MPHPDAGIEPALRVLAMLRGVLKVSLNLDVGYRSAGSAFLRRAGTRSRAMFPAGEGRWCARVLRSRPDACVRDWTRLVHQTRRTRRPVECACHAGLTQYSIPVRRRGRMVGMVLCLQAPAASAGGFRDAYARVRDLPGTRGEWRADFDRLPALPTDRIRSILEMLRDMTEAVLELSASGAARTSGAVAEVMARAEAPRPDAPTGAPAPSADLADRARSWLEAHPGTRASRTHLARALGCSPATLSRQFKRRTGLSLPEFSNRQRVARARELLAGTAHSIADVAARSGFGTRRQFLNVFRRQTGLPPRRFRRRMWEEKRDAA